MASIVSGWSQGPLEIGGVMGEQLRRQGIGQQLIEKVKGWAARYTVHKIRVRCNTTRTDSYEFYLKAGFTKSKKQKIFDLPF